MYGSYLLLEIRGDNMAEKKRRNSKLLSAYYVGGSLTGMNDTDLRRRMDALELRVDDVEIRLTSIESQLTAIDARLTKIEYEYLKVRDQT